MGNRKNVMPLSSFTKDTVINGKLWKRKSTYRLKLSKSHSVLWLDFNLLVISYLDGLPADVDLYPEEKGISGHTRCKHSDNSLAPNASSGCVLLNYFFSPLCTHTHYVAIFLEDSFFYNQTTKVVINWEITDSVGFSMNMITMNI